MVLRRVNYWNCFVVLARQSSGLETVQQNSLRRDRGRLYRLVWAEEA